MSDKELELIKDKAMNAFNGIDPKDYYRGSTYDVIKLIHRVECLERTVFEKNKELEKYQEDEE